MIRTLKIFLPILVLMMALPQIGMAREFAEIYTDCGIGGMIAATRAMLLLLYTTPSPQGPRHNHSHLFQHRSCSRFVFRWTSSRESASLHSRLVRRTGIGRSPAATAPTWMPLAALAGHEGQAQQRFVTARSPAARSSCQTRGGTRLPSNKTGSTKATCLGPCKITKRIHHAVENTVTLPPVKVVDDRRIRRKIPRQRPPLVALCNVARCCFVLCSFHAHYLAHASLAGGAHSKVAASLGQHGLDHLPFLGCQAVALS